MEGIRSLGTRNLERINELDFNPFEVGSCLFFFFWSSLTLDDALMMAGSRLIKSVPNL